MRRLLTWLVVSLGIAAIIRKLRRREQRDEFASAPDVEDDPADELRRKLADSRSEESAVAEPPVSPEPPVSAEATVEERRADVHEQGRSTLDDMRGPDED
jgi:hypothetical protein